MGKSQVRRIGINAISGNLCSGARTYLINLLPAIIFQRPDWELVVWHNERDDFLDRVDQSHYTAIRIPETTCNNRLKRLAFEQWGLIQQLRINQIDLLFSAVSGTSFLARCISIPTVAIIHQLLPELVRAGYFHRASSLSRLAYMFAFSQLANRVIVPSNFTAATMVGMLKIPSIKLKAIYHGGAGVQFCPIPRSEAVIRAKELLGANKYILSVSTLYRYKNYLNLIRAYAHLVKKYQISQELVIIGKAADRAHVQELQKEVVRQGLPDRVRLIQGVDYNDLPAIYSAADLFVNPSLIESFGLTQIEAMSCGTPVVSSRASAMPEICSDAALYFNPTDPEEMAKIIAMVLRDENIRTILREKGLQRAVLFSWDRTARETIAVFEDLLSGK